MVEKYFYDPFAVSGDRSTIPETAPVDGSINYVTGYGPPYQADPATDPTALNIPRDKFNELMYQVTLAIQALQQGGFPRFITSSDNGGSPYAYDINKIVRWTDGNNYISLVTSNTADPTDGTSWALFPVTGQSGFKTGDSKKTFNSTLESGYVWENGQTIGDASSGATGRANSDTSALFSVLWTSFPDSTLVLQSSTGTTVARGVSAAADFAAHRRLGLPDSRGRVSAGKDDMGGVTAAGRITNTLSGISGATLNAAGGSQSVELTASQNGPHTHSGATDTAGDHFHGSITLGTRNAGSNLPGHYLTSVQQESNPLSVPIDGSGTSTDGAHQHNLTTSTSGTGADHQNTQPTLICNWIIKL